MLNQQLMFTILQGIDTLLKNGVLPVSDDHLEHLSQGGNILEYLIAMKNQGWISGDLITISSTGAPHRITNIRLTYSGIRALRQ